MPTASSYEKELEAHVAILEEQLEVQQGLFHVPVPDDVVIVKEDHLMTTGRVLSYNRNLVKVMDEAGLIDKSWDGYESWGNDVWLKTYVAFTIPAKTKMSIVCYEVKKRKKKVNWNQNFVKFSIIDMPNVPKAAKKTLRLTIKELYAMKAEIIAKGEVF